MDKKSCFQQALLSYFRKTEMHSIRKATELTNRGEYQNLCFMTTFKKENKSYRLLVPMDAWHELLREVDKIFASKINQKLVQRAINHIICGLREFPFRDETLNQFCEDIYSILSNHSELQFEAIIPLYNIFCTDQLELSLANTTLHSGHSASLLAKKVSHPDLLDYEDHSDISNNSFLCIRVTGDEGSRLSQVELESEQALKVLRFITFWQFTTTGNKPKKFNPANVVSIRKTDARKIFYHQPNEPDKMPLWHADIKPPLYFNKKDIADADKHFGLNDINYHCNNVANSNSFSNRVLRALDLYDSGTRALTTWQALYRYVACINVALPTSGSKGDEIKKHLKTLIKNGGNYIGTLKKDAALPTVDVEILDWDSIVRTAADPFSKFYKLRSQILHGNSMTDDDMSMIDGDIEYVRQLAHNTVRLIAKVSRKCNWKNDKEAKNWFEQMGS